MLQLVELHFRNKSTCDFAAVLARSNEILGTASELQDPTESDQPYLILHPSSSPGADVVEGLKTSILRIEKPTKIDEYREEILQSWRCRNAVDLLRGCKGAYHLSEVMTTPIAPHIRLQLFHGVLQAMVEAVRPDALVFKHTQQVVAPEDYHASCNQPPFFRSGSLNVRFFNYNESKGELLMDTRGLTEIGLPDLQCYFKGLDPGGVSSVLFNTARFLLEQGPALQPGQTVRGVGPNQQWDCKLEDALVEPKRKVVDLNPGKPHAGGKR